MNVDMAAMQKCLMVPQFVISALAFNERGISCHHMTLCTKKNAQIIYHFVFKKKITDKIVQFCNSIFAVQSRAYVSSG